MATQRTVYEAPLDGDLLMATDIFAADICVCESNRIPDSKLLGLQLAAGAAKQPTTVSFGRPPSHSQTPLGIEPDDRIVAAVRAGTAVSGVRLFGEPLPGCLPGDS